MANLWRWQQQELEFMTQSSWPLMLEHWIGVAMASQSLRAGIQDQTPHTSSQVSELDISWEKNCNLHTIDYNEIFKAREMTDESFWKMGTNGMRMWSWDKKWIWKMINISLTYSLPLVREESQELQGWMMVSWFCVEWQILVVWCWMWSDLMWLCHENTGQ